MLLLSFLTIKIIFLINSGQSDGSGEEDLLAIDRILDQRGPSDGCDDPSTTLWSNSSRYTYLINYI